MAQPVSYYALTIADNTRNANGKPTTTRAEVPIREITAATYDAVTADAQDLRIALDALILGNVFKDDTIAQRVQIAAETPAASALAQRENKWLCRYHDNTSFDNYTVSFGTADLTKLMANSEFVDLSLGEGAAFKAAFEAVVVSPADDTHTVTLDSMQFVGRNT